jgi:hypothetical protein
MRVLLGLAAVLSVVFGHSRAAGPVLTSSAFADGATIPREHTCDGRDESPPLRWAGLPDGTKAIALIADDPDAPAGTWTHWVLYDLPADARELPRGVPTTGRLPSGARQGLNDFGRLGYAGPCPPPGKAHRYVFRLLALDAPTGLGLGASADEVRRATDGHRLGTLELRGTYGR